MNINVSFQLNENDVVYDDDVLCDGDVGSDDGGCDAQLLLQQQESEVYDDDCDDGLEEEGNKELEHNDYLT